MMNQITIAILVSLMSLGGALAQESKAALLEDIEYPELVVTPLASDRLNQEMSAEKNGNWSSFAPLQLSALTSLLAGSTLSGDYSDDATLKEKDNVDNASMFATVVGGGWLITSLTLQFMYEPYAKGYNKIKGMPTSTKKEKLTRERFAEQEIISIGSLGRKLKWLSFGTNLLASAAVIAVGQEDSQVIGGLSLLAAFGPLLFETDWEKSAEQHEQYKKKIYGPIGGLRLNEKGEAFPTISMYYSF